MASVAYSCAGDRCVSTQGGPHNVYRWSKVKWGWRQDVTPNAPAPVVFCILFPFEVVVGLAVSRYNQLPQRDPREQDGGEQCFHCSSPFSD
jgi:hypothetical protein